MGDKIKALIHLSVYCPDCGSVLYRDYGTGTLRCEMTHCPNFNVRFKVPTIDLERVEDADQTGKPRDA